MVEQLTGAGIVAILVLGYVLIVQAMTAAVVLLAQFIVVQVRALWSLFELTPTPGEPSLPPVLWVPESRS